MSAPNYQPRKFLIDVVRIGYGYRTVAVEAETLHEAQEKALDAAGNLLFSESVSEYEIA